MIHLGQIPVVSDPDLELDNLFSMSFLFTMSSWSRAYILVSFEDGPFLLCVCVGGVLSCMLSS